MVRFKETDAGGVVYFAELLSFCHEAYEDALAKAGIDVRTFFSKEGKAEESPLAEEQSQIRIAVPIVHTEADFFKPLFCGDRIAISLVPKQLTPHSFEIAYEVFSHSEQKIANALTRHVAIRVDCRDCCPLPDYLTTWIASFA